TAGAAGAVAGAGGAAGAVAVAVADGAPAPAAWARTSPLVIRPPRPVPSTCRGSMRSSATIRRAAGESGAPAPPLVGGAAGAGPGAGAWAACGLAAGLAGAGAGAWAAAGLASVSIVPTVAPIVTVVPSGTATLSTPDAEAGTTLLALSVSSSNSG